MLGPIRQILRVTIRVPGKDCAVDEHRAVRSVVDPGNRAAGVADADRLLQREAGPNRHPPRWVCGGARNRGKRRVFRAEIQLVSRLGQHPDVCFRRTKDLKPLRILRRARTFDVPSADADRVHLLRPAGSPVHNSQPVASHKLDADADEEGQGEVHRADAAPAHGRPAERPRAVAVRAEGGRVSRHRVQDGREAPPPVAQQQRLHEAVSGRPEGPGEAPGRDRDRRRGRRLRSRWTALVQRPAELRLRRDPNRLLRLRPPRARRPRRARRAA